MERRKGRRSRWGEPTGEERGSEGGALGYYVSAFRAERGRNKTGRSRRGSRQPFPPAKNAAPRIHTQSSAARCNVFLSPPESPQKRMLLCAHAFCICAR